jgi:hypothetical protein
MSRIVATLAVATLMLAASGTRGEVRLHGTWVKGQTSSCELACGSRGLDAFRSGHYGTTSTHYTICRYQAGYISEFAGRPGFQHQAGSPNRCKIHGYLSSLEAEGTSTYDCLCAPR